MLGNLSRQLHLFSKIFICIVKYSERCKKLAKSPFQIYLQNNRTQGSIEQHFDDLKCNSFGKKRLSKLDEFIYDYHSSVLWQEKQFGDYYFNGQHKTRNNRKNTSECNAHHRKSVKKRQKSRLVEAIIKKRKPDTTLQCAKKLQFKSLPKAPKEKFVNNFSNTHYSTNFIFFPVVNSTLLSRILLVSSGMNFPSTSEVFVM